MADEAPDLTGRVVVLTGASRGIGRAAATMLARMGATLVLVSRRPEDVEAVAADVRSRTGRGAPVTPLAADLSSMAGVRDLAARIVAVHPVVHVLLNNAGTVMRERVVTAEGHETTFAVNHLAAFTLTAGLRGALERAGGARVITVASEAHHRGRIHWRDPMLAHGYSGFRAYCQSKLANVMFTLALARRLEGTGVVAHTLHPGVIATQLLADFLPFLGGPLARAIGGTPEDGADTMVWLAHAPEGAEPRPRYWIRRRPAAVSRAASDVEAQERLWGVTEELVRRWPRGNG